MSYSSGNNHHGKIVGAKYTPTTEPDPIDFANAPPLAIAPFDAEQAKQYQEWWADYLGVDVEMENSIGMKFRLIPPGEFLMGSTEENRRSVFSYTKLDGQETPADSQKAKFSADRFAIEMSQVHRKVERPYYLGSHEVTNKQFGRFTSATSYRTELDQRKRKVVQDWLKYRNTESPNVPVHFVSLHDGKVFSRWLTNEERSEYRLPYEVEWEYACRAGSTTPWFFGESGNRLREFGWFLHNSNERYSDVGSLRPNPFGIFDVYGNVWEICLDQLPVGVGDATRRTVKRGGSVFHLAGVNRSAARGTVGSQGVAPDDGFRIVREIPLPKPKQSGPTIDLLKLIDPKRDAVKGEWKCEGDVLVTPIGSRHRIQLPIEPPDEYDIDLIVERKEGGLGLVVGLFSPSAGSQFQAVIGGAVTRIDGLETASVKRDKILRIGDQRRLLVKVRRNSIDIIAEGEVLLQWVGDPQSIRPNEGWSIPNQRSLYLGASLSVFHIHSLKLTPITGQPKIDLLSMIDPGKDAVKGEWEIGNGKLVSPAEPLASIQLPFIPPSEYDLQLKVRRIQGNDGFGIGLVSQRRQFAASLDGWGSTISGLSRLKGRKSNDNVSTFRGAVFGDRIAKVLCSVRRGTVTVNCDGKVIIDWRGDEIDLSLPDGSPLRNDQALFVGAFDSTYEISELTLTPISGESRRIRD